MLASIYVGYPMLAVILGHMFRRPVGQGPELPTVTMVISVHNEEKHIGEKIGNVLSRWDLCRRIPRLACAVRIGRTSDPESFA